MKKLDVLGEKVSVKIAETADKKAAAQWIQESSEIRISPDESEKYYLLIHELTHSWLDRIGTYHTSIDPNLVEMLCHNNALVMTENAVKLWQMFRKLERK